MKPGPIIAMVLLPLLGVWLIWNRPDPIGPDRLTPGAELHHLRIGASRGLIEVTRDPAGAVWFRVAMPGDERPPRRMDQRTFATLFGDQLHDRLTEGGENALFRLFNITSWANVVWIAVGLGGQAVFMSRFLIQWIVSERRRESVIPTSFWWISLTGAILLFAYFVWRRDIVGVLGQSTGVVIYARNLRLIHKQRRRERREGGRRDGGDEQIAPGGREESI